jgi:hypothetical protein
VPLTHPVQRLSLEQPQPESQVTIPWELEWMARLPESQLGFSPTLNPRPECEEEEEGASIVFLPLYQRNSNPEVASIVKSPVVLLAQHSHDSDESEDEDFYSVGSIGKTGDGEKLDSGNNEDCDDGKTGDGEKLDSGNNEDCDDGKTGDGEKLDSGNKEDSDDGKTADGEKLDSGNKEDSDDDLLNRVHRLTECHQSTDNVVEHGNEFISRVDVLLQGSKEKSSSTDVSAPLSLSRCVKDAMQPRSDKATKAKTTRRGTTQKAPPTRTSPRAKKRNNAPTRTSPRSKKRTCAAVTAEELSFPSSIDGKLTQEGPEEEEVIEAKEESTEEVKELEEERCCYLCGKTPCEWIEYGIPAIEDLKRCFNMDTAKSEGYVVEMQSGNQFQNNKIRFTCYRLFTYEKFGHLGKGNRVKLPVCVESKIQSLFPSLDGNYTTFKANPEYNSDQS